MLQVRPQQREGLRVKDDPPALVCFRVLLPHTAAGLGDARPDVEDSGLEVDPVPAQRAELTAPGAGSYREPDEHPPVRVGPRLLGDPCGLLRRRRLRVGGGLYWRLGLLNRVDADPAPADGAGEGAVEDVVDLADLRAAERFAPVRTAAIVALVRGRRPVLHEPPAAAVRAARPQLLVEGVERLAVELADRQVAEQRLDV